MLIANPEMPVRLAMPVRSKTRRGELGPDFPLAKTVRLLEIQRPRFFALPDDNSTPVLTKSDAPDAGGTGAPDRADLRPENINDAVIRLAGNSQDGIQSAGAFLARLAGRSDQDVMTYMTIPSTISGGPSLFQVRIGTGEVLSSGDEADFLVAFYQHSYQDNIDFLKEGGVLLYDSDNVEPNLDDKRFVYVGVPITGLTVEALGGTAKDKGKNIFVLGLISKIFSLDVEKLKKLITERFAGKDESIVNTALMAFQAGYAYPVGKILSHHYQFEKVEKKPGARAQITMDGNQAIAYGLIAAGVRYGAGYPITPWSSIMEILRSEFPKYGGIFVQAEDELGAVSLSLGFSYSDISPSPAAPARAFRSRPKRSAGRRWPRFQSSFVIFNAADRAPVCRPTSSKAICIRRFSEVTVTVRASCSPHRRWKIVSTSRSKPRGSRASTARRS